MTGLTYSAEAAAYVRINVRNSVSISARSNA
jgi:hypothetical protein